MTTSLTPFQFDMARSALLGRKSDELIQFVFSLNLGLPTDGVSDDTLDLASQLGWITSRESRKLTILGQLIADPIREYRLWLNRDRRIHGELDCALLAPESYRGKRVLEPGSGFGCNLLSLSRRVPGEFIGVEPVAVYRQLTPVFSEREGLPVPYVVEGTGEKLPFEDASFDVVLCYSAHQYMDVRMAILEMSRVLKPGGQVQIIGASIQSFMTGATRQMLDRPSVSLASHAVSTSINTLSYQLVGHRCLTPKTSFATATPVYPTRRAMHRWFRASGLIFRQDLVRRIGPETCFVADKPS